MSNDDTGIISKEGSFFLIPVDLEKKTFFFSGFLQTKLSGQPKWHRRYCIIDWDKALLFIASKTDRQYGDYIKLLPSVSIIDSESPSDLTIEIVDDSN